MKLTYTTAALAAAMLAMPAAAQPVINDSFLDGSPANSGDPLESTFYTTSSGSALDDDAVVPPRLDFASGGSGRAIHTIFSPVTLGAVGDNITASFTFTTPASVGTDENNGFRVGLFNQGGMDLAQDISSSSTSPNALLQGPIAGFSADYDVNDLASGAPADEVRIRQSDPAATTGRLLTTTGGFNSLADMDAPGDNNGFAPNTTLTGILSITRTSATEVEVTSSLGTNSITTTATADAFDYSFLGFGVSSDAFGSSNTYGDPDNGLDFSNVAVTFMAVPEPASFALLAAGAGLLVSRRRKA